MVTQLRNVPRSWPYSDLRTYALQLGEQGTDGFHRSWIPILPEGAYDHPQWGTLDFSEDTLQQIKQNFDAGVRGIEIALDYDHKASEGDSKAPGWIEKLDFGDAIGKGDSPEMTHGLWAYVRWTRLGLADIKDQIYRYVSAEVKPEYHADITGKDYKNVLVGATLTNRPFMKNMPSISLAEISRKPWGSVNKSKLPRSCFLIKGTPDNKDSWKLPVYEGAGPLDADGHYTQRGALNINGVKAALGAIHGARSGQNMSGVPAGTVQRLQNLLKKYSGGDGGDSSSSTKASEGVEETMTRIKSAKLDGRELSEAETLNQFLADRLEQRGDVMLSSTARAAKAKMAGSRRAAEPDDEPDGDEADGNAPSGNPGARRANRQGTKKLATPTDDSNDEHEGDYAEDGGDDGWDGESNTHPQMTVKGHSHGKFGQHSHDGDADHSDAPVAAEKMGDPESDDEMMDEGANLDGIDEELDADDDDSDALDQYLPKADLTGPKAVTGRATAPLTGAGKNTNVGRSSGLTEPTEGTLTLEEARELREQLAQARYQLHETKIGEQLRGFAKLHVKLSESQAKSEAGKALAEQQVAISKRFRDLYRKFMLSDGYKLSEGTSEAIHGLIKTALEVAIVDLSRKGTSFDMEERRTIRASDAKNGNVQDQKLVDSAEMIAQRDYHVSLAELRVLVKEGDHQAREQMGMVYRRAAKESGYTGH